MDAYPKVRGFQFLLLYSSHLLTFSTLYNVSFQFLLLYSHYNINATTITAFEKLSILIIVFRRKLRDLESYLTHIKLSILIIVFERESELKLK